MSWGRSLKPLSLPAGMSTLTLTVRIQLGCLSYAYLDFEGWAAETKHESRGSSHKTQQRAIFHDHISQTSHTLLIDKQK